MYFIKNYIIFYNTVFILCFLSIIPNLIGQEFIIVQTLSMIKAIFCDIYIRRGASLLLDKV